MLFTIGLRYLYMARDKPERIGKWKMDKEIVEKAFLPRKWLKIDETRYDLIAAAKTAELATNSIMDDGGDAYDMFLVMETLLGAVKRACDSLKESIEEWQAREPYLDSEGVTDAER